MQPINRKPQAQRPQERRPDPSNPYVPHNRKPAIPEPTPVPQREIPVAPRRSEQHAEMGQAPQRPAQRPVHQGQQTQSHRPQAGHAMRPMAQPRIPQRRETLSYESNIKPIGSMKSASVKELFGQKAPQSPPPRDPAPSRTRYKLQRLWLTPMVRRLLKASIPAMGLCAIGIYLGTNQQLRDDWANRLTETRKSIETRPEFMVNLMKIQGVSPEIQEDVRTASGITLPLTSFDLDLPVLRKRIESLDQVKSASLHLRTGGVLDVVVQERQPVVLWRSMAGIEVLDVDGVRAGTVKSRLDRPKLPLIAGDGANLHIAEAMQILKTTAPIKDRVRGLLRVGERRWDLILNRSQTIQLPEENPIAAVERLIAWQSTQSVLSRDITIIDLRNSARPYLRLAPNAVDQLRKVRASASGEETKL